ncbi:hypothetical protein LQZ18_01335 [Lachnospiraceae bacterium ZAX-1]
MTDNELLLALSSLFDKKLKPVEERLNRRMDNLETKIDNAENRLNNRMDGLETKIDNVANRVRSIEFKTENDVLTRLQNIESYYTSTYDRYKNGILQIEALQIDMDIVKNVVKEHGEKLRKIS